MWIKVWNHQIVSYFFKWNYKRFHAIRSRTEWTRKESALTSPFLKIFYGFVLVNCNRWESKLYRAKGNSISCDIFFVVDKYFDWVSLQFIDFKESEITKGFKLFPENWRRCNSIGVTSYYVIDGILKQRNRFS